MPDHTRGPWSLTKFPPDDIYGSFVIKEAPGGICRTIGGLGEEERANAQLIEASPDLLEALLILAGAVFGNGDESEPDVYKDYDKLCELKKIVDAALIKARKV